VIGALLVLVFVGLVALSLWGIVDASLQPDASYRDAGLSKGWVTGLLILTCAIGSLGYLLFVRPRLRQRTL
jgi:hypothetical protein